ncbi:MAG: BatA protein [Planctomycetota bacterium]
MIETWPTFRAPEFLALLPVAAGTVYYALRRAARPTVLYSSVADLRGLPVSWAHRLKQAMPYVRMLGLGCLIVALARPQQGITETLLRTEGIAIQAALDTSGSMDAMDFTLDGKRSSRMEAVKRVFTEFVAGAPAAGLAGRPDDPIGLVAFGGYADSRCPLTLDHGALVEVVKTLDTPKLLEDRRGNVVNEDLWREEQRTAIGDAIALSLGRLKEITAKSKVIVLLSDGVNNAGVADPVEAARAAKEMGIRIYSIGIGQTGSALFPVPDRFGKTVLRPMDVELDERLLKEVASMTGGQYFNAKDTEALRKVYAEIDRLERTETERRVFTDYHERYPAPLLAGLVLLLLDGVLAATRLRTLP